MLKPRTSGWIPVIAFLLYFVMTGVGAAAQTAETPAEQIVRHQAKQLPTEEIETYWDNLLQEYGGFFPDRSPPSFIDMIVPGGEGYGMGDILAGLTRFLFHELLYNGRLLVMIVVLTVF